MRPADRIRDHSGQGAATTVAAHRTRRRLRADQATATADPDADVRAYAARGL